MTESQNSEVAAPAADPGRRWLIIAATGILVLYLGLAGWIARTGGVWSPDCGARLIQVQSVLAHPPDWSIVYPAAELDPRHNHSPLAFYDYRHDGKSYVFYSFVFALASAPFFAAFGYFGLAILPVLGGLAAFFATYALARKLRFRYPLAPALITALVTPLPLYSVVFWDHAILTAIGTAVLLFALWGVEKDCWKAWLAAGVLLGAGLWLHEILAPYIPALLVMAWWLRRRHNWSRNAGWMLIGAMALVIPLLIVNAKVYGSPAGPHLSNNKLGSADSIGKFLLSPVEWIEGILYTLFAWGDANPAYTWQLRAWAAKPWPSFKQEIDASIWLAVPMVIWMLSSLTGLWRKAPWLMAVILIPFGGAAAFWLVSHQALVHGPFLACPFLALAFIAPLGRPAAGETEEDPLPRLLLQGVAVSTLVYAVITMVKPTLGGTEWGSRHLLSLVPATVLLGWAAVERMLASRRSVLGETRFHPAAMPVFITAGALLLASIATTLKGADVAHGMHQMSGDLARAIEAAPDRTVVTSVWWAATSGAPAYAKKQIVSAEDEQHPAPELFGRMRAENVRTFTLLGRGLNDLIDFAIPAGYVPIRDSQRNAPMHLITRRYMLVQEDEPTFAPAPPP